MIIAVLTVLFLKLEEDLEDESIEITDDEVDLDDDMDDLTIVDDEDLEEEM